MTEPTPVRAEQPPAARGPSPLTLANTLVERMGPFVHARAVYGEPVRQGNVTVVPVARVRWVFGAGGGEGRADAAGPGTGGGGGGAVSVSPVGFIEIRDDEAHFRRIRTWDAEAGIAIALVIAAGGLSLAMALRAVRRIVRG
jgi:uncharacterized spore protein YtfJ